MEVRHDVFWPMINEIRTHVAEHGVPILARDDSDERTIGFETACPRSDVRHRYWRISLANMSRSANLRADRPFEEPVSRVYLDLLMNAVGRNVFAEALSTGQHPSSDQVRRIREAIGGPLPMPS